MLSATGTFQSYHHHCLYTGAFIIIIIITGAFIIIIIIITGAFNHVSLSSTLQPSTSLSHAPPETIRPWTCYASRVATVSVSPSGEIVEGSSVTLSCTRYDPATTYTWYKKYGNQYLQPPSKEPQLVFRSIRSSDSGEYYCTAENKLRKKTSEYISINVKYAPRVPSVSVSPSGEIVEGSSVTLTCSSDANPAANYTWYKEDEDSPKASGQIFTITDFRPEHSGNYYCEAQNRRGRHNFTFHLIVVAGKSTIIMNIIRLTLVGLMLIPLLLLSLWTRKKKTLSSTTEPHEPVETIELDSAYEIVSNFTGGQTGDTEQQEDTV